MHKSQNRKGFNNLRCIDYSPMTRGLVAAGQEDGLVKLFDILTPHSASLDINQDRTVNDLSFSTQGLLAAGYERTKSGNSLLIYNINQYSKTQGQEVTQPTFQFVQNETILSTVFYNETNLLVGSSRFIRDIDIRVSSPVFQVSTKTVYSISQDPYNQYSFAAFAEDGTLSIYDRRKLTSNNTEPVLSFNKLLGDTTRRNNYSCYRYSWNRRGEFATSHGGELIRRWHTGAIPGARFDSNFVSSVNDVKTKYDRVISFDYSEEWSSGHKINLICMRQSGSVFKMPIIESEKSLNFNSFNDLAVVGPSGVFIENVDEVVNKVHDVEIIHEAESDINNDNFDNFNQLENDIDEQKDDHSRDDDDTGEDDDEDIEEHGFYTVSEVLRNDISVQMRRRAYLGYGTNCRKNLDIIDSLKSVENNNLFMRSTWRWLEIALNSANTGLMTSRDLDLSFEGVLGIWKGVEGLQRQDRFKDANLREDIFQQQITEILSVRNAKSISIVKSHKEPQRRLCMILAGFYFNPQELEQIYAKLTQNGQYTKAAGWAVFIGDVNKAVRILSSAKSNRLRLIATAISGYLVQKKTSDDNIWKDQCRQMSFELTDPYLKAIFAYIADNDWWAVLEESSLPLRERIGVALRCLSDKDLTIFLNRVADKYISKGELEGLILTGITPRGIDLLQSYVNRTSDVQTASIISSFGFPKYFKDERAENWIHSYRTLLNSWGMFSQRAKFDVSRAALSRTANGKTTLKPIGSQVMIQCARCNKNISKTNKTKVKRSAGPQKEHSSSCPHCGAALPKCAICLLALGKPLPLEISLSQRLHQEVARLEEFKEWPSFCLSCNHGMHAGHAEEWFSKSNYCPVPGCSCRCNNK